MSIKKAKVGKKEEKTMREEDIIIGQEAIYYNANGIRCLGRVYSYDAGEACGVRSIKIKPYTEEKFVDVEPSRVELIEPIF